MYPKERKIGSRFLDGKNVVEVMEGGCLSCMYDRDFGCNKTRIAGFCGKFNRTDHTHVFFYCLYQLTKEEYAKESFELYPEGDNFGKSSLHADI